MEIDRRRFLLFSAGVPALAAVDAGSVLRGRLTTGPGDKPALRRSDGTVILLAGDEDTVGVLRDKRLADSDFEVVGRQAGDTFAINPIHTAPLYAYKDGRRLRVTYWCDVCAIRTYAPGLCWCCREETKLELREPDKVDTK